MEWNEWREIHLSSTVLCHQLVIKSLYYCALEQTVNRAANEHIQ